MLNQALSLKSNRKLFSAFSLKSHHTQPAPPPKNPNSAVKDVDPKSWWCDQTLWLRVTTDSSLACLRRGLASRVFAGGLAVLSSFFLLFFCVSSSLYLSDSFLLFFHCFSFCAKQIWFSFFCFLVSFHCFNFSYYS
jgi:hypothetical protein